MSSDDEDEYLSNALVMDVGSWQISCGFSGDDEPRGLFKMPRSCRWDDFETSTRVRGAFEDTLMQVEKWYDEIMEREYEVETHGFAKRNVLMTAPTLMPRETYERLEEMMYETFGVEALSYYSPTLVGCYTTGRTTATLIDVGHSSASSSIIYEGFRLYESRIQGLGGSILPYASLFESRAKGERVLPDGTLCHLNLKHAIAKDNRAATLATSTENEALFTMGGGVPRLIDASIMATPIKVRRDALSNIYFQGRVTKLDEFLPSIKFCLGQSQCLTTSKLGWNWENTRMVRGQTSSLQPWIGMSIEGCFSRSAKVHSLYSRERYDEMGKTRFVEFRRKVSRAFTILTEKNGSWLDDKPIYPHPAIRQNVQLKLRVLLLCVQRVFHRETYAIVSLRCARIGRFVAGDAITNRSKIVLSKPGVRTYFLYSCISISLSFSFISVDVFTSPSHRFIDPKPNSRSWTQEWKASSITASPQHGSDQTTTEETSLRLMNGFPNVQGRRKRCGMRT